MGPASRTVAGTRWMFSSGNGLAAARLLLGDRVGFESAFDDLARFAREMRNRGGGWHVALWRAMLALLDGRFGEAEALAAAAYEMGPVHHGPHAVQLCKLALEQGRTMGSRRRYFAA